MKKQQYDADSYIHRKLEIFRTTDEGAHAILCLLAGSHRIGVVEGCWDSWDSFVGLRAST